MKKSLFKSTIIGTLIIMALISFLNIGNWLETSAYQNVVLLGKEYLFYEDEEYTFSTKTKYTNTSGVSIGKLNLGGDYVQIDKKGSFDAYDVKSGNLSFKYSFEKSKLAVDPDKWSLYEDSCDEVDGVELENDIGYGAIIVQTSLDGIKWVVDKELSNVFTENSVLDGPFYNSKSIQLINGCYYRILVVYEERKRSSVTDLLVTTVDNYDYRRTCDVYEFYAINSEENQKSPDPNSSPRRELGERIKTEKNSGFSVNIPIENDDPHLGWSIGTFIVNGYTRDTVDNAGDPVFLKNVGDRVTLWFNLKQDINRLNNNEDLSIDENDGAYDQYFEVSKTNFKHGTLIIRYTDREGKKTDPIIYTDYLAACARTGAYTKVELFEEGDYEVALNYRIKDSSSVISSYSEYRIFFKFSIRNGNCMVFPFDNLTKAELSDKAITPNGFKLDMARSRYLTIDVKRIILKKNGTVYVEDVRFNRPAQDGEEYKDEGIYRFTVKNLYTGESTEKTIFVGESPIYLALSKGGLTLDEINDALSEGGELCSDGTLVLPEPEPEPEITEIILDEDIEEDTIEEDNIEKRDKEIISEDLVEENITGAVLENNDNNQETKEDKKSDVTGIKSDDEENGVPIALIVIISILVSAGVIFGFIYFKKLKNRGDGTITIVAPEQVVEEIEKSTEKDGTEDNSVDKEISDN